MKLNNRGMTLIEMVVAFAILGIMSVSVFGIILTSTKTYTKMTSSVKLQYEAQLAMANIEKRIMNCNYAISWGQAGVTDEDSKKELFIVNEDASGDKTLQVIYRKTTKDELHYGTAPLVGDFIKNENISSAPTFYLLSEHVDDIKMQLVTTTDDEGLLRVKQVKVTLTMKQNDITYTTQKTIALRNQPLGTYQWTMSLQAESGSVTYPTATPEA